MARSPSPPQPTPPGRQSASAELELEAYKQASEDFRQINQIFWQAPGIIITITGGLAVAVATLKFSPAVQCFLLIFAGICNAIWALLIFKLRFDVMNKLLNRSSAIYSHSSDATKRKLPDKLVMWCFVFILSLTALGCFLGAANVTKLMAPEKLPAAQMRTQNFVSETQVVSCPVTPAAVACIDK